MHELDIHENRIYQAIDDIVLVVQMLIVDHFFR
jgi:hypothetical protein